MPQNVNQWLANWRWTGSDIATPQAQVDFSISWKEQGEDHSWSGTLTFPNDFQLMSTAWLKRKLEDLIVEAARLRLGIDPED